MRIQPVAASAAIMWILAMMVSRAGAWVDLELVTDSQAVPVGGTVEVELVASWDGQGNPDIIAIDAVLAWGADVLELQGAVYPTGGSLVMSGPLPDDSQKDGLNNSRLDGSALFTGVSFETVTVPVEGMLVATFEFLAVGPGAADVALLLSAACSPRSLRCLSGVNAGEGCVDESDCPGGARQCDGGTNDSMVCTGDDDCPEGFCTPSCTGCIAEFCCTMESRCSRCSFAETRVLSVAPSENVTGVLRNTTVTAAVDVSLSATDVTMPAGSTAPVVVSGAIFGQDAVSVTIAVELVARAGATGTVTFTPAAGAADVDIEQLGDPWVDVGFFQPFDTNDVFVSALQNGSIDDNGSTIGEPTPTSHAGPLTGFPIVASEDARGVWDVILSGGVFESFWDAPGLDTDLDPGVVVVVAPHDSDGSETVDLRDAAAFARCYTGFAGPPAYPTNPALRCRVFDSDQNGDIDEDDLLDFNGLMSGPSE